MANELRILLFYLLIVFVWSAECSQNQSEKYPTGGAGESKTRFKRAIGGSLTGRKYDYECSWTNPLPYSQTLWTEEIHPRDSFADGRFYGLGITLHDYYIIAQKFTLMTVMSDVNFTNYYERPIQYGDFSTEDFRTGIINVKQGLTRYNGSKNRKFRLSFIVDVTKWFRIAERLYPEKVEPGDKQYLGPLIWAQIEDLNKTLVACWYVGWSQELQNGTKKADTRYWVEFPVKMTPNSCKDHVCELYKSDGLPGGFCNTYQESGSPIFCKDDLGKWKLHYIVIFDPDRNRGKKRDCKGKASAYHVPYLVEELKKVLIKTEDLNWKHCP